MRGDEIDERALRALAYRMLGGWQDAEDAVQEARIKAWSAASYEERGHGRAWVYRILIRTCLDLLRTRKRRMSPREVGPPVAPGPPTTGIRDDLSWLEPYPDALLPVDPEAAAGLRSGARLAWVRAVQVLSPRQRAALVLSEVLDQPAGEIAETLGTSVAAVNSLLQRARATLARDAVPAAAPTRDQEALALGRLVRAWETGDFDGLVELLAADARLEMPPWPYWLDGRDAVVACSLDPGTWAGDPRPGRYRMVPTAMNGQPAALAYVREADGRYVRSCLTVLGLGGDGRIAELLVFVLPEAFEAWGFPVSLG